MTPDLKSCLIKDNIFAIPIVHYNMEMAAEVRLSFERIHPDCVAVELAETMRLQMLHAASRLPDISLIISQDKNHRPLTYMCEPCDGCFEALRSALEKKLPAHCIDLDIDYYPDIAERVPDPYSLTRIGLKSYYDLYQKAALSHPPVSSPIDLRRELYMAQRLKELSLSHDRVLFVGGISHIQKIFDLLDRSSFPPFQHAERRTVELCTPNETCCRDLLFECGWISTHYEEWRKSLESEKDAHNLQLDRQKIIYSLYRSSAAEYQKNSGNPFPGYHMRNLMKFARNYSLFKGQLTPNLYQILSSAKGCVDHNYAYEVWELATSYPFRRNVDNLPEVHVTIEEVWGKSKILRFHLKTPGRKSFKEEYAKRKEKGNFRFQPPGPFSICSYPPEDLVIERLGDFLKKKGTQIFREEAGRTIAFSSSIEDGLDMRETIRHWHEKKLFVKTNGKPPGGVGSVVVIFDEDASDENRRGPEKYSWHTTWLGEHSQESDMAFYATPLAQNVVGPGISRCEYGGFMMSYPPRRMHDVWTDEDYRECRTKAEVLLMAAIDYAAKPLIVYVAAKAPRTALKSFASRFGKKLIYIPIGQLSPVTLNKLRLFHVLDGHDKRAIADEYIS